MKNKKLEQVENIMFEQINILRNLDSKNKAEFTDAIEKTKTIAILCDKVIQCQNTELKQDVWEVTKKVRQMKMNAVDNTEPLKIEDMSYPDTDDTEYIDER